MDAEKEEIKESARIDSRTNRGGRQMTFDEWKEIVLPKEEMENESHT